MNLSRINRLIKLIGLLQSGRGRNVSSLASDCEVSRRTIFRDLEALREGGVPLVFDQQQQYYRIPGTYFLPPTNFTPEEALAVITLCHELGDSTQLPFFNATRTAAVKLENSLPHRLRDYLSDMGNFLHIKIGATNPNDGQKQHYDQLVKSISKRRCVRISYDSFTEKRPIRTKLSPYKVFFHQRSWFIVGRSSLHRMTRMFNLSRILSLEPLDDKYTVPRGFTIERFLGNAWRLIPESGPDRDIVIRFKKKVAQNVAEVMWHKTQQIEFQDDGSIIYRAKVSGLHEISWWILGYGDQAEVCEPSELCELIAGHIENMAKYYRV